MSQLVRELPLILKVAGSILSEGMRSMDAIHGCNFHIHGFFLKKSMDLGTSLIRSCSMLLLNLCVTCYRVRISRESDSSQEGAVGLLPQ